MDLAPVLNGIINIKLLVSFEAMPLVQKVPNKFMSIIKIKTYKVQIPVLNSIIGNAK
jgi:hypothetical protein